MFDERIERIAKAISIASNGELTHSQLDEILDALGANTDGASCVMCANRTGSWAAKGSDVAAAITLSTRLVD